MNQTIDQLINHRSYRHFEPNFKIPEEEVGEILKAAKQAPTWMNGQFYSIIRVTDMAKRDALVTWSSRNPHLKACSELFIMIADLYRTSKVSEAARKDYTVSGNLDALITAVTDASLAAENLVVAAESFGYGTIITGGIRQNVEEIKTLFNLPDYTYPLFAISIGKPAIEMKVKPRLPQAIVVGDNSYPPYNEALIKDYDKTMEEFGEARETVPWTVKFENYFETNKHPITLAGLKKQKFL